MLVAQRAHAFGMRLVAYDPFVSADRARQLGVQLVPTIEELVADSDFVTIHATEDARHDRPRQRRRCSRTRSPGMRLINAGRGGIVDEDALADAIRDGRLGGAAIDTFAKEPTTESPLFELDNVVVTPHLGASTAEAQDKAGETIAEQVVLALRGDFVPFAVNVAASEASETRAAVPAARRAARAVVHRPRRRRADDARDRLRRRDRRLRLPRAHAVDPEGRARAGRRRAGLVRERAAARGGARHRRCARRSRPTRATT